MLKEHFARVLPEAAAIFRERAIFSAELGRRKPDPETIHEHARRGGFPANLVTPVGAIFGPDTAG